MNDQIAVEAAEQIFEPLPISKAKAITIIKSAIEKAHEDGYRQGAIDGVLNERESRAARASEQGETLETLRSCRDHWKTAFEHERGKVIRLSNQIHAIHGKKCICTICELVKTKSRAAHGTSAVADASEPRQAAEVAEAILRGIEKATKEHQAELDRLQAIIEKDTIALMAEREKTRVLGSLVDGFRKERAARAAHASEQEA